MAEKESYNTTDVTFWTDGSVRTGRQGRAEIPLELLDQVVYHYLFTNRHVHLCGIYYMPEALVAHELRLPLDMVNECLDALEGRGLIERDHDRSLIWVVSKLKRRKGAGRPSLICRSIELQLKQLDGSPLIARFLNYYAHIPNIARNIASILRQSVAADVAVPNSNVYTKRVRSIKQQTTLIDVDTQSSNQGKRKSTKNKKKKNNKTEDDFITRILRVCSEARYSSTNSQVKGTTVNPHDGKSRQIARQVHDHVVEQARVIGTKHEVKKLDTERELRYIGRLYERFLEHKNHNPDAPDFIVDANYPFIAFYKHLDEWIAAEGREESRRAYEKSLPPQKTGGKPKFKNEAEAKAAMRELLSGIGDGGQAERADGKKDEKES